MRTVWENLLDHNPASIAALDSESVQNLELRAPGIVAEDNLYVGNAMDSGGLFRMINHATIRSTIKRRLLNFRGILPSLKTLFEDTKYLDACVRGMRLLIPPTKGLMVRKALEAAFEPSDGPAFLQADPNQLFAITLPSTRSKFIYAYQQLWLFNMRHFPDLSGVEPRKEKGRPKSTPMRSGASTKDLASR
ncbi:hypothetical protein TWF481_002837 [Arthrobotrys musiformis]|uniref:Uncharacterized protein n=1 Tax=Arthrobotrys musiformis TaxID=47236 RepID=A0AAV9VTB8_9PEZI